MPRRATAACVLGSFLCALPGSPVLAADVEGAEVLHGTADIKVDGNTTTITTGTRETIVEYDRFGVAQGNKLQIDQPDAGSKIMNRVRREGEASRIDGTLSSNGIVLILNPAGVFFGDHALVDVAGLIAGAGALSNQDFLSGVDRFTDLEGEIGVEAGAKLHASGDIALLGRRVENLGSVLSDGGAIAIVAGGEVRLAKLDGHVSVQVDAGPEPSAQQTDFALTQAGRVEGRQVTLAVGDHYSLAMNHTGVTRAGEIHVQAGPESKVELAGTLDASNAAPGGSGGRIAVQAGEIAVDHATLDASGESGGGEILLGGDVRGGGDMPVARRLEVGPDSLLIADARQLGDGGKIILYSVERTAFLGALSAQGGAQGGDGGFAEISGAKLVAAGKVDLGAARGESGTLLYDPDVVEIRGGSGTPTDDGVNSVLFENGLETTNANIVIEAVDRIFATGDFVGDAVVIMPGNDLTLRTTRTSPTGAPADIGIDLQTQTAEQASGDLLSWQVSQGANILIQTQLAVLGTPTAAGARANIVAGRLTANGAAFESNPDLAIQVPDRGNLQGVTVSTSRGDIDVTAIESNGEDSRVGFSASGGGQIVVATAQGDIEVGSAQAKGGDSVAGPLSSGGHTTALEASPGGVGGSITLDAGSDTDVGFGSLTVGTPGVPVALDVSGGEGRGALQTKPDDEGETQDADDPRGGDGGVIQISASGEDGSSGGGQVHVSGDMLAKGGAGIAVEGLDGEIEAAFGGEGGVITVSARGGIDIAPDEGGETLVIDASGGDGARFGGNAVNSNSPFAGVDTAIAIQDVTAGNEGGVVAIDAALIARGGNGRVSGDPTIGAALLPGGSGGAGGDILVGALDGSLESPSLTIDASGGEGNGRTDPETGEVPVSNQGVVLFAGGAGRTVTVQAKGDLEVGQITAAGGAGKNAFGGQGSAGGVSVRSDEGVVRVHGIDSSGGDAELSDGASEGIAIAGGRAGTISVQAPGTDALTGGIELAGELEAEGGTGVNAAGDPIRNSLGTVTISTDGDVDAVESDARVRGHVVQISADRIGAGGVEPVSIAGTGFEDANGVHTDRAVLTVTGDLHADVVTGDASVALGSVEIQQLDAAGASELESAGDSLLHADGATDTTPNTLTRFGRGEDGDPALIYRLDVTATGTTPQPALALGQDAIDLGSAGGEIANGRTDSSAAPVNRGAIVAAAGSTAHGTAEGTLRLTGSTIGAPGAPIVVNGGPDASLRIDAQGAVNGAVGTPFAAIDILQRKADAGTDLDLTGSDVIEIDSVGTTAAPVSRIEKADTTVSGSGFSYRLLETNTTGAADAKLEVDEMRLGGTGRLVARGDIVLRGDAGTAITTGGHGLTLESAAGAISQETAGGLAIDMRGTAPGGEQAQLVLLASTGVGTQAAALQTAGVEHLAGATTTGSFVLANDGTGEGPLRIERVTPVDPAAVGDDHSSLTTIVGIAAFGEEQGVAVDVTQTGTPLVLGDITDGAEFTGTHVFSQGSLALHADQGIQIENARFLRVKRPLLPDTFVALNDARLAAFGDVVLDAPSIRTSDASTATSDDAGAPDPRFVHGSLELESAGTVHLNGDLGCEGAGCASGSNPGHQLALFDTTRATIEGDHTLRVADARFRGTLDGAGPASGGLTLIAQDASSSEPSPEGHVATALFEGNIGAGQALTGLDVQAERIVFTSADRIATGAGGVHLSTNQAPGAIPEAATIEDRSGGLAIQTSGAFTTGDADEGRYDKLSVAGPLSIQAASVRVSDLSASRSIEVSSPDITIVARDPAPILLKNGETPDDKGTDWVADKIALSSVPVIEGGGPDTVVTLGVGGGGVSAPGKLSAFEVRRFNGDVDPVETGDLFGANGQMLDLTATGDRVVGNPSTDLPRERATTTPSMPPQFSEQKPAPAPAIDAEQLLAYLRCGEPGSLTVCDAAQTAPLEGVADFPQSALATPRAAALAASWRDLRSRDLSAAFDAAGAGFRAASGFGELDGARFGAYLESSPEHADARAAIHELASILVEVDLLGLSPDDEIRVRRQLASEFAAEADVPGFDADGVLAAVAATPIGIPGK